MSTQKPYDMGSSQSEESGAKAPTHIDYKLENIIAEALDNGGVPNVFCGHGLLSVYGLVQEQKSSTWVIPNFYIAEADSLLQDAGFHSCHRSYCEGYRPNKRPFAPAYHYHVQPRVNRPYNHVVLLYKMGDLFIDLAPVPTRLPPLDDPDYMLVDDPRLPDYNDEAGNGRWQSIRSIKIPKPARFIDAVVLLMVREWPQDPTSSIWYGYLSELLDHIDECGDYELVPSWDVLGDLARGFVKFYFDGETKKNACEVKNYISRVRDDMIEKTKLSLLLMADEVE
ncbi:uncharacterized protein AtWU_02954 [Aspergillus tubingensis]|uniref:Uncharacterized protein n=1 Tax=Aspergillus niger TaxID=5061 RepID=A0A100IAW0_ASPNG|nr:uncharacterized protein AtWU_02954 [Aspergillus tubingensis]GAQ37890.1 hypothetical protein AKAW_01021 [Aspergillus niger]GFN13156.1 hypothetical protein AtWU_02954 [Aspergillus tubingensis]GLA95828.1 hypothetical protein AtubIFM57143_002849 [Aspergillus tubingensis]